MSERSDQRIDWIDAAKGAAIILVVFGHTWRGLYKSDLVPQALFAAVDSRLYAFHMPVFFAIAGWFFIPSLAKASFGSFARGRLTRLLWPIILWTYLFLGVKVLAGSSANTQVTLQDLMIMPIPGSLHLWFLWTLLVMSFAFFLLKPFCAAGRVSVPVLAGTALVILAVYYWQPPQALNHWIRKAPEFAPFMFLGMVLAQYRLLSCATTNVRLAALGLFALILAFWPQITASSLELPARLLLTFCFLALLSATSNLTGTALVTGLRVLGIASMAIYLMHTIFSAALREGLLAMGVEDLTTHVILGTLIGIVASLIGFRIAQALGLSRILGF